MSSNGYCWRIWFDSHALGLIINGPGGTGLHEILTTDQIIEKFADDINADQSLKPGKGSMLVVAAKVGMDLDAMNLAGPTLEYLTGKLKEFGHLYITYFSVVMHHAVVGHGASTTDGVAVMDPTPGPGLIHRQLAVFKDPSRLRDFITIGWPVPAVAEPYRRESRLLRVLPRREERGSTWQSLFISTPRKATAR